MRTRKNVLADERLLTAPRRVFGLAPPFILTRDRGFSPLAAAIEPRYRKSVRSPPVRPAARPHAKDASRTRPLEWSGMAPSMWARRHAGISPAAHSFTMVNYCCHP